MQDRADQLAVDLENAKIDCTDVLELSYLIDTLGVDLMVVRMKWARVAAQLTQEKYKASPDGKPVENVSDSGDTMTVDEIAQHAACDPKTIQRDRKILKLRMLAQGERYSPGECLQFFRRRAGIGKGKKSTHLALLIEAYEKYGLMDANAN